MWFLKTIVNSQMATHFLESALKITVKQLKTCAVKRARESLVNVIHHAYVSSGFKFFNLRSYNHDVTKLTLNPVVDLNINYI